MPSPFDYMKLGAFERSVFGMEFAGPSIKTYFDTMTFGVPHVTADGRLFVAENTCTAASGAGDLFFAKSGGTYVCAGGVAPSGSHPGYIPRHGRSG